MICTRDFCNVLRGGETTGFQVKVRINYYRGCYLSMIDTIRLVVDGEEFPSDKVTFTYRDRTYTFAELARATTDRWFFGDPATLTVSKPGGLKPGMHTVQLGMFIRVSYIPRQDPENLYGMSGDPGARVYMGEAPVPLPLVATKKMTLVQ